MKKFAGFTAEEVNEKLLWVVRCSTGERFVGNRAEVDKFVDRYYETEWDYIKDIDVLCGDGQNADMKKFVDAWEEINKKHGFKVFWELFEEYGEE